MSHPSYLSSWSVRLRRGLTDMWFILSVIVAILLFAVLFSYHPADPAWITSGTNGEAQNWFGRTGAFVADILVSIFGYGIYLLPIALILIAWQSIKQSSVLFEFAVWKTIGLLCAIISLCGILSIHWPVQINELAVTAGGYLGQRISLTLLSYFSMEIVMLIYTVMFLAGATTLFNINWLKIIDFMTLGSMQLLRFVSKKFQNSDDAAPNLSPVEPSANNKKGFGGEGFYEDRLEPGMAAASRNMGSDIPASGVGSAPLSWDDYKYDRSAESKDDFAEDENNLLAGSDHEGGISGFGDNACAYSAENLVEETNDNITVTREANNLLNRQQVSGENPDSLSAKEPSIGLRKRSNSYYNQLSNKDIYDIENASDIFEDAKGKGFAYSFLDNNLQQTNNNLQSAPEAAIVPDIELPSASIDNDAKGIKVTLPRNEFNSFSKENEIDASTEAAPDHNGYHLPPLSILSRASGVQMEYSEDELKEMAFTVKDALKNYKIDTEVVNIEVGPVVTRIELDLAPGVKVSQISNLDKDLARSLSVRSVRVVEVIPGKPYIGLEIPNKVRETVHLRNILESAAYRMQQSPLTVVLGADIGGKPVVANLGKMPHLLVAGTTGSGKSVAINVMLASMLYKATPQDLRLILIDPKMLEMSMYEDIPHLLTPVVTDMNDAENALRWAVAEMERRYQLMSAFKVRNLAGFNQLIRKKQSNNERIDDPLWKAEENLGLAHQPPQIEPLPMIVIVIDELADMMMAVGKKVEELIARIAQKARAAGIHLILATQRPSVDVITGLIKANVPTRLAFQVSSKIDSRTIIDQQGAETLLGYGDGLFVPPGSSQPQRIHGAFIEDAEVDALTQFIKSQGEPDYEESITNPIPGAELGAFGANEKSNDPEQDALYDEACQLVIEEGKASISWLQRRLAIGYNRSARLMEAMEQAGLVSSPERSGSRRVLVGPHGSDNKL